MANVFSNPTVVAKEALRHLKNNCVMGRLVHRGYEEEFKKTHNGWNQGDSITVNAPNYFRTKSGRTVDAVELKQRKATYTVDDWHHVAWTLNAEEMTLDLDKWSERYLMPAMQALANKIDVDLLALYKGVPNQVGTPGTTPSTFYVFAQAKARLTEEGCPADGRSCVIEAQASAKIADNLKGVFATAMVNKAIRKGEITKNFAGFTMYESQNVNTHTVGTWASVTDVQKDAASSEGDTTLALKSTGTTETLLEGDIFTIAACNSVNPISGMATGSLRQFVVNTSTVLDGSGEVAALAATPGQGGLHLIYSAAAGETDLPYQTMDALPADNAAVTVAGTTGLVHPVSLAFHKDAFGLCMVPIVQPASVAWGASESYDGYHISVIRYLAGATLTETIRFDILYGKKVLNPFLACRIAG